MLSVPYVAGGALCRSLASTAPRGRFQQLSGSVCALGRALPGLSARFALPAKIQLAGWAATGSLAGAAIESLGHVAVYVVVRGGLDAGSERSSSRSTISCAAAPGPMLAACRTPGASSGTHRGLWRVPQAAYVRDRRAQANVSGPRRHAAAPLPTQALH